MQTHVTFTQQADLGYLTFACDEPGKPATLDYTVLAELETILTDLSSRTSTLRALILQNETKKYFVVGANIKALQTLDEKTIGDWVRRGHEVFNQLEKLPLPVIAKVEGFCLGGGLELAMACDLIVAANEARFGQPEAKLGLIAGWGGTYRLPRRVGVSRAKELFFSGQIIDALRAYDIGLVDFVGESEAVEGYLAALLAGIQTCSPLAVAEMKTLVHQSAGSSIEMVGEAEAAASQRCYAAADTQQRLTDFFESRR
jgi:enoyl-CoA hydratase